MSIFQRFGRKLVFCGVAGGVLLFGWAARHSSAAEPSPGSTAAGCSRSGTSAAIAGIEGDRSGGETRIERLGDRGIAAPGPAEPLSVPHLAPEQDPVPAAKTKKVDESARATVVASPEGSSADSEDPEKVANTFLEQNRKLAEAQLKALKDEAEKLKARLTKIEAGMRRWERLLAALNQSQTAARVDTPPAAAAPTAPRTIEGPVLKLPPSAPGEEPTELSPVPRGVNGTSLNAPGSSPKGRHLAKDSSDPEARAIEKDLGIN